MNKQEIEEFIENMKALEMAQADELVHQCSNKFIFAKTYSNYKKDFLKTKKEMERQFEKGETHQGFDEKAFHELIEGMEDVYEQKLKYVERAFSLKFNESIFNYLGQDGMTRSPWPLLIGLFVIVVVVLGIVL